MLLGDAEQAMPVSAVPVGAFYYGSRNYTSTNGCAGGGVPDPDLAERRDRDAIGSVGRQPIELIGQLDHAEPGHRIGQRIDQ